MARWLPFAAAWGMRQRPGSNHIRSKFAGFLAAMRIAEVSLQCRRIRAPTENPMPGNRNILYLIIGALIVAVGVLGYNLYQTRKQPEGLQINVGPNGLKIQNK
jgi:hypothetical protein